ncbi:MAG: hypothetical protein Q4C22_01820 [Bacillota bacterium]|nr:hypothetical protein [Bacillota bacterium]
MKKKKHLTTLVCLIVGMLVLTSAVYANYDSASGYSNYKDALKYLAFNTNNVTIEGSIVLSLDGEELLNQGVAAKYENGENKNSIYSYAETNGEKTYQQYVYDNGKEYVNYDPETNSYYSWEYDSSYSSGAENLMGVDMNDSTERKAIRFAELLADTLVGDLKNNVVLVSQQDGVREYAINLSQSQIPEVVNAGLSFLFTASNAAYAGYEDQGVPSSAPCYVSYEDYYETFQVWCASNLGEESLTEEDMEALMRGEHDDQDRLGELMYEMDDHYETVLTELGDEGILHVAGDGSYTLYATEEEYDIAMGYTSENYFNSTDVMLLMGDDPYISDAVCKVTLDEEGRLIANYIEATLTGVDENGQAHSATLKINAVISDYGTTVADVFDAEGKIEGR